jgi:hypothetical protein
LKEYLANNKASDARNLMNSVDLRRLPYSQGNMGQYVDRMHEICPDVTHQAHGELYWTAVHFLICSDVLDESDKIHAIKTLIVNAGFHIKQVLTMSTDLYGSSGNDPILNGQGTLLLCAVTQNFILLKYLLSEEFSSMWTHHQLDSLLNAMFQFEDTTCLVCVISSPSFSHYYESLSLDQRKVMKDLIIAETNKRDFNTNVLGDVMCNQPYTPQYLMYLISEFRKKRLEGSFDNFQKACFNVNIYQLDWLSKFDDYYKECFDFMSYMHI